jgi:hypothetical protein
MTESEARTKIEKAGGSWEIFCKWMYGQTIGINPETNEPDIYEYDVERFISYKCNPAREPLGSWD